MSRFENVDQETVDFIREIIGKDFERLVNAKIKILFDTKKRKSGGNYTLGRMQKANDLIRTLTFDETEDEGYDYILYLDKVVWSSIDEKDKERLVRHELCHCDVDFEKDNPYALKDHEITDFYSEIEYNKDDPRWAERIAVVAEQIYENE
jgi:hypothetical protein